MTTRLLLAALLSLPTLCAAQTVDVKYKHKATGAMVPAHNVEYTLRLTPTAEELSQPGALETYIKDKLRKGERVQLPGGVIRTKPFEIDALGGVIRGVGYPSFAHDVATGWANAAVIPQATTTIVADGPHEGPLITLRRCKGLRIQDLGVQTDGVGMHLETLKGWGCFYTLLDRVAFINCSVGFEAGRGPVELNGADVEFRSPIFMRCGTGVRVNHSQGVNFVFTGLTRAEYTGVLLHHAGGGVARLNGVTAFNLGTVLKMDSGGSNLGPNWITQLYLDRDGSHPPTTVLDAGDARGAVRVVIDGYQVSLKASDYTTQPDGSRVYKWADHQYVIRPKNPAVDKGSLIKIRDAELNGYAGGVNPVSN